jgi:hypothetical protein
MRADFLFSKLNPICVRHETRTHFGSVQVINHIKVCNLDSILIRVALIIYPKLIPSVDAAFPA